MTLRRPKLLDLFCGAGGAAVGYHQAGFDVTGVDIEPQPHYPFTFIQADAMTFDLSGYDAIHASPPCQGYSRATPKQYKEAHVRLIEPMRERLLAQSAPWTIESTTAKAVAPGAIKLCGEMFRLGVLRHRWFECSFYIPQPEHQAHRGYTANRGAVPLRFDECYQTVAGRYANLEAASKAMGIKWMDKDELAQAIPPAYTSWLGKWLYEAC